MHFCKVWFVNNTERGLECKLGNYKGKRFVVNSCWELFKSILTLMSKLLAKKANEHYLPCFIMIIYLNPNFIYYIRVLWKKNTHILKKRFTFKMKHFYLCEDIRAKYRQIKNLWSRLEKKTPQKIFEFFFSERKCEMHRADLEMLWLCLGRRGKVRKHGNYTCTR